MRKGRAILAATLAAVLLCAATVLDRPGDSPRSGAIVTAQQNPDMLARLLFFGGIGYSSLAVSQMDSAYRMGFASRREPAMCVASMGYAYGVAANQKAFVYVYAFAVTGPQAAKLLRADSVTVDWDQTVCGDSLPSWHGHIVDNAVRYRPSDCDFHMVTGRPQVPFHIVQSDLNRASLYWPSDKVMEKYATNAVQWCGERPNLGP
jgi:hypothetical protein